MLDDPTTAALIEDMGARARAAARVLATATSDAKRAALLAAAAAMEAGADAVLAASIFHFGEVEIAEVKDALAAASYEVRK